mgnify:CR=1 FL=1
MAVTPPRRRGSQQPPRRRRPPTWRRQTAASMRRFGGGGRRRGVLERNRGKRWRAFARLGPTSRRWCASRQARVQQARRMRYEYIQLSCKAFGHAPFA